VVWLLASLIVCLLGSLVSALSDWPGDRLAGSILIVVALFGAGTAYLLLRGNPARRLSLIVSAVFVIGGVATGLAMMADGVWFVIDLLIFCGVPIVAALITGLLALRARAARGHP
jgi:hypothetical protein